MNIATIIAIGVFFIAFILGQRVVVNQYERLDDEMRLKVGNVFVRSNSNYTVAVLGIILMFFAAAYAIPQYLGWVIAVYALVYFAFFFGKIVINARKLRAINAPANYTRAVFLSYLLFIGGAVLAGVIYGFSNSALVK